MISKVSFFLLVATVAVLISVSEANQKYSETELFKKESSVHGNGKNHKVNSETVKSYSKVKDEGPGYGHHGGHHSEYSKVEDIKQHGGLGGKSGHREEKKIVKQSKNVSY